MVLNVEVDHKTKFIRRIIYMGITIANEKKRKTCEGEGEDQDQLSAVGVNPEMLWEF